jgi:hypothetical protein
VAQVLQASHTEQSLESAQLPWSVM